MSCDHKRLKCVNCAFVCLDCGAKVEIPVYKTEHVEPEPTEKPKRRAKKGETK